jgi:hypothetical protein
MIGRHSLRENGVNLLSERKYNHLVYIIRFVKSYERSESMGDIVKLFGKLLSEPKLRLGGGTARNGVAIVIMFGTVLERDEGQPAAKFLIRKGSTTRRQWVFRE